MGYVPRRVDPSVALVAERDDVPKIEAEVGVPGPRLDVGGVEPSPLAVRSGASDALESVPRVDGSDQLLPERPGVHPLPLRRRSINPSRVLVAASTVHRVRNAERTPLLDSPDL